MMESRTQNALKRITLPVGGMTCASCQSRVQRAIAQSPGVSSVTVNLLLGNASVWLDESINSAENVASVVRDNGYECSVPAADRSTFDELSDPIKQQEQEYRELKGKVVVGLTFSVLAMVLSFPVMNHEYHPAGSSHDPLMMWLDAYVSPVMQSMLPFLYQVPRNVLLGLLAVMTVISFGWIGNSFFTRAWKALKHRTSDMNTLVALGSSIAFLYSLGSTLFPDWFAQHGIPPDAYYEAAISIIALVLTGRMFESRAKRQTTSALRSLANLRPDHATVASPAGPVVIPLDQVICGDIVYVKPGERIPVDGVVANGSTAVDESMITGESIPVFRTQGDHVIGGTVNGNGAIEIEVTAVGEASAIAGILRIMRDAQAGRSELQQLADRVSVVFVPTVIVISIVVFLTWMMFGVPVGSAMNAMVSVLIIACPCAMGLAIPAASMVATGRAASLGILIKGGEPFQQLAEVDTVVFDKTGTITNGKPVVTSALLLPEYEVNRASWLDRISAIEARSEHPLATAFVSFHPATQSINVESFQSIPGRGASAIIDDQKFLIGNAQLMIQSGLAISDMLQTHISDASTQLFFACDDVVFGCANVSDPVKAGAKAAISAIQSLGIHSRIVSGDSIGAVQSIAKQVDISEFDAAQLPVDKVNIIKSLQQNGHVVAMVGDGINDAPSLAQANCGIALGTGTDIAGDAASVIIMRGDVGLVGLAIELARRTQRTMKQNLGWAFIYNLICIPVAAGVFMPKFGFQLSPMLASAAMAFSSISVVLNSIRLNRFAR